MEFDIFNLFAYLKDEDYDKFEKSIDYILEKKNDDG
jgi:hypothetical protein